MMHFMQSVQTLANSEECQDGLKIGSMCTGWGVAEMVVDGLNTKLSEMNDAGSHRAVEAVAAPKLAVCLRKTIIKGFQEFQSSQSKFVYENVPCAQLRTEFMCECVPWKIEYLKTAFPNIRRIFDDMRDLHRGKAKDAVSGKIIDVPDVA